MSKIRLQYITKDKEGDESYMNDMRYELNVKGDQRNSSLRGVSNNTCLKEATRSPEGSPDAAPAPQCLKKAVVVIGSQQVAW